MSHRDTIQGLIDSGEILVALHRGSGATDSLRALQTLLYQLGFGKQLKWDQYGADGDYGRATSAAVRLFARRNGLDGNGEQVTAAVATRLLARHDALDELQRLHADLQAGNIDSLYYRRSPHEEAVAALQTLLHDLGFDSELSWFRYGADGDYGGATTRAVSAFARQEGITSDGQRLTTALARRILARLRPYYGDEWSTTAPTPSAVFSELIAAGSDKRSLYTNAEQDALASRSAPIIAEYTYSARNSLTRHSIILKRALDGVQRASLCCLARHNHELT